MNGVREFLAEEVKSSITKVRPACASDRRGGSLIAALHGSISVFEEYAVDVFTCVLVRVRLQAAL